MSLCDLGKNDVSEETQALKDRLASRDTENAGLRTRLMRREAELEEIQETLDETIQKLSKEAQRALQLEEEASARSCEVKTQHISLRNSELALQSAQEKLKTEEREKRELESTLDTLSVQSQATSANHQSVQREKRALESRVRELERIVQTHEAKNASNIPRKNGRSRSSSVSNFRLPAVEQELNDTKAQLHAKDTSLHTLEQKLAQAQDDLIKAENARISIEKSGQKRISELSSLLDRKEDEFESLRGMDNAGEREVELLERIDEDAAKITALEKLVSESEVGKARVQKLQNQLKAECDKVHRSEDVQNRLLREKEELLQMYKVAQCEVEQSRDLLATRECQIKELEVEYAHLAELDARRKEHTPADTSSGSNCDPIYPDQSAIADHIQTLLQAVDRLRNERDGLKRALEFSEDEYRITTEGFQARIKSLTRQLAENARDTAMDRAPTNIYTGQRMKRLASCATAFTVVISNLQTHLDLSEGQLSAIRADLASSNAQLHDALAVVDCQKQQLVANARDHDGLLLRLDEVSKELSESNEERGHLHLRLADVEGQVAAAMERANTSETAREEMHQNHLLAEQHIVTLNKNCQDTESERNSFALQITNLQNDLARAQDESSDAQGRYDALHAQQLSTMSTSQVVQTLKDRIRELETRIMQYTDQIGDYQRDIRRLEANAKHHEERIAEMTSELDILATEKEAMVEDCAGAREARDEAVERSETAEEEAEKLQQQLQQATRANEAELSAMSSVVANLESENQQATTRLLCLEAENARFIPKLESLNHERQRLGEQLNIATSRSASLELENSRGNAEMQQSIISLAVIHRVYKDSVLRLQRSYGHIASLESQLMRLRWELEQKNTFIDSAEQEKHALLQRLSDVSSQDDTISSSCLKTAAEEKEQELLAARQLLEEAKSHYSERETELLGRIAKMSMESEDQAGQAEDIAGLEAELDNARTQLENSRENFADLEKLHSDVVQEFVVAKEAFEFQLAETEEQIRRIAAEHQQSLASLETKYARDADVLANNLEDREQEVDELRQELQNMSEAHARAEGEFHEELKILNDLESDLRRQLSRAETNVLAMQAERQSLQVEITGLQAESQRSASLSRYMEGQVRESENTCILLKDDLERLGLNLAESEKAGKAAEFNLTLQATQHEKVVGALRQEIASLQSGPELHTAIADLEEKNREMDDLLRAKCQEIEEYDDRILETLKANKKLTSKVDSLTRKVQALQAKLSSMKTQPREPVAEVIPPQKASPSLGPASLVPPAAHASSHASSSHSRESSVPLRHKTPEPRIQPIAAPPSSHTPGRPSEPYESERSAGKKRPAPDDDERDSVPAEGHYSTDACLRNGPTPRLRRAHGHPAGFTPVRGASLQGGEQVSPVPRANAGVAPSEIITDVTNNPRGPSGQGDMKKRSWLGKIRGGTGGPQPTSSRRGAFGGQ